MEDEPWYQFTRIIVNSCSHNFRYEFRKYDKKFLPTSYKDIEINEEMEGALISMPLQILIELVDEIIFFAKERIT